MKRRKYFLCIAVVLCTLSIIGTVCYAYERMLIQEEPRSKTAKQEKKKKSR